MNQQSKRAIKALVLELRHTLEDDIDNQLKRFGYAGGRWIDSEKLPHIWNDDAAMAQRQRMDTALAQELRRMGVGDSDKATAKQREEAAGWFVREIAYTHLNRLVALKALEVRGLIPEVITTRRDFGDRSRAHYDLRNSHPELCRGADEGLSEAIRQVSRLVYRDFRLLFDVGDPADSPAGQSREERAAPVNTLIWPGHTALRSCVAAINHLDTRAKNQGESLWLEDEIIGWLYQFYNAEQKEAIRKRGKPRRPAEVAVINQFFTPRWVVKFLVDNTLGRLWLEMHPDSERVRTKCDYLVPEPLGGEDSQTRGSEIRLDPDSPINNPHAAARRLAKRPQEIRLIDPACGTMHFGHYAFEVFQEIYAEARERGWVMGAEALPDEEVPAAILRHNLYGVDIDLRAVQLAGLSLYIKARSAEAALGLEETRINQVNLVVADAVLPQDGARTQFLAQYDDDRVVQDAVRQVLDEMANVAEVGSLLRVEERLRDILGKAGHAAAQDWDSQRQGALPGLEPEARQRTLAEAAGAVPEQWGAHYTVARLLEDLRAFAAQALHQHDLNAQLFAQEASKSVHLLDVFLNEYDVAVMNPPYGSTTELAKQYLRRSFPQTSADLFTAFTERGLDLVTNERGYVGTITSRTFLFLSSLTAFRRAHLLGESRLITMADLGFGVLDDALVETAAYCLGAGTDVEWAMFLRLLSEGQKDQGLQSAIEGAKEGSQVSQVFSAALDRFQAVPQSAIAYWVPARILEILEDNPQLDDELAVTKAGLQTSDSTRFIRYHWEVRHDNTGRGRTWTPIANINHDRKYYRDYIEVVLWKNDGEDIRSAKGSVVRNESYYHREGLTFPITGKALEVQYLPEGLIFSINSSAVFPMDADRGWSILGLLNSRVVLYLVSALTRSIKWPPGYIARVPVPNEIPLKTVVGTNAQVYHDIRTDWDTGNELSTRFDVPWLVQVHRRNLLSAFPDLHPGEPPVLRPGSGQAPSLPSLLDDVCAVAHAADSRLQALQAEVDETVYDLYEISAEDRALIERELGDRPPELVWPQMERKSDREKLREHVRRLVSWCLLETIKADPDGILTLDEAVAGVRDRLEAEFGEEAAFRMEADIKGLLGKDLAGWLDGPFVKWHTKLYKKTPIVWHLTSDDSTRTLNLFLDYHKLDGDTLRKVQTLYLWPAKRRQESQRATAQARNDPASVEAAELALEALEAFEGRLLSVIQARVDYEPPDWAEGPFRGGTYDPVIDDGVKVNLLPLQEAGLLRYRRVI